MITRIWHGRTRSSEAKVYRQYVKDTGIPDYLASPGNLGAQVWQREEGDITHIWTVSWWDSYDNIRIFAGEDLEKARYYEKDRQYLLEMEPTVIHCDTEDFRST